MSIPPASRVKAAGRGKKDMKIRNAKLNIVCGYTSTLPETDLPEIAFAGRSNVGKSSLINVLMQRKRLARVGETPGKTRTINFYEVDALVPDPDREGEEAGCRFHLVDLPGYGYARVSASEKEKWGKMVERYLRSSRSLKAVFLLVDIRHEPNANDRQMYEWIRSAGFEPILIATKADKVKKSQFPKQRRILLEGLGAPKTCTLIPFSALDKSGRDEICASLEGFVI